MTQISSFLIIEINYDEQASRGTTPLSGSESDASAKRNDVSHESPFPLSSPSDGGSASLSRYSSTSPRVSPGSARENLTLPRHSSGSGTPLFVSPGNTLDNLTVSRHPSENSISAPLEPGTPRCVSPGSARNNSTLSHHSSDPGTPPLCSVSPQSASDKTQNF